MVNFPCSVCEKPVGINHEAVCCIVTNVINGYIWDAIITVKKLTDVSRKTQHHGIVRFIRSEFPFSEFHHPTKNGTIIHKKQIQEYFSLLEKLKTRTCLVNITITNNSRN